MLSYNLHTVCVWGGIDIQRQMTDYNKNPDFSLSDKNKLKKLSKNTTGLLKIDVNKLITAEIRSLKLHKIADEYYPGYLYICECKNTNLILCCISVS